MGEKQFRLREQWYYAMKTTYTTKTIKLKNQITCDLSCCDDAMNWQDLESASSLGEIKDPTHGVNTWGEHKGRTHGVNTWGEHMG